MRFGNLSIRLVSDGGFRLDGGAMFGVVPKTLWERAKPADESNRISMATNCLLVDSGDDLLLVDTGLGDKLDEKSRSIFALDPEAERLPAAIRRAGYRLDDVTHVLLTHLHFDHCGWNTRREGERLVPTFPRATYWLPRGEVEHARAPNLRDGASYDPRNWEPLFEAGVVELFDERATPVPGVEAIRAPGHTRDMAVVRLDGGSDGTAAFWADLIPTAAHVAFPWIMGFDLYPMQTLEEKKRWIPVAATDQWLSIFEHDPDVPAARIVRRGRDRYRAEPDAAARAALADG